jgi:phage shock protein PspC (stress-responsive transcriptional regulator)
MDMRTGSFSASYSAIKTAFANFRDGRIKYKQLYSVVKRSFTGIAASRPDIPVYCSGPVTSIISSDKIMGQTEIKLSTYNQAALVCTFRLLSDHLEINTDNCLGQSLSTVPKDPDMPFYKYLTVLTPEFIKSKPMHMHENIDEIKTYEAEQGRFFVATLKALRYIRVLGASPCIGTYIYSKTDKAGGMMHFDATCDVYRGLKDASAAFVKLSRSKPDNMCAGVFGGFGGFGGITEEMLVNIFIGLSELGYPLTQMSVLNEDCQSDIALDLKTGVLLSFKKKYMFPEIPQNSFELMKHFKAGSCATGSLFPSVT